MVVVRGGDGSLGGIARPIAGDVERAAFPTVFCPFSPRISPHVADVQRYAVEWAVRHRLLADLPARAAFARARFAHLIARAYPDAGYADLCLAAAWLTFTFQLDDYFETVLGVRPGRQREAGAVLLSYLLADDPAHDEPALAAALGRPLAGALADVWSQTTARAGAVWRSRFVGHIGQYLAANAWEADNRAAGQVPGIEEYLRMRRHSAATAQFFDLIEVFGRAELSARWSADPQLRALRRYADNVVAWFNDLVSWPKERAIGDPHNLVLVLQRQERLSSAAAVRRVVARHDQEVRRFVAARAELRPELRAAPGVERLVTGLAHWIRANVDWSAESGRYG
jgi:Terpene synthase family 2, C-terminal metal binding